MEINAAIEIKMYILRASNELTPSLTSLSQKCKIQKKYPQYVASQMLSEPNGFDRNGSLLCKKNIVIFALACPISEDIIVQSPKSRGDCLIISYYLPPLATLFIELDATLTINFDYRHYWQMRDNTGIIIKTSVRIMTIAFTITSYKI